VWQRFVKQMGFKLGVKVTELWMMIEVFFKLPIVYMIQQYHLIFLSMKELKPEAIIINCIIILFMTYHVTDHVRPHQPIVDQQGLGLRGLVHKEAHPVIPDLHVMSV